MSDIKVSFIELLQSIPICNVMTFHKHQHHNAQPNTEVGINIRCQHKLKYPLYTSNSSDACMSNTIRGRLPRPLRISEKYKHGSQSRSRPPTRPTLRRIGLGVSDRYRVIRNATQKAKKNSEKITTNLKKMQTSTFMYHMSKIYHLAH